MFQIMTVDDKNTRLFLKAVLEAENYTVLTAENEESRPGNFVANHVGMVVLDIMMPRMDAYAFTKALRESS